MCTEKKKDCLCTHCSKTVSAGVCVFTSDQSCEEMLKRSITKIACFNLQYNGRPSFKERHNTEKLLLA